MVWRNVFIIEGAIAIVLLFIWFPLISDRPRDAKWISKEEKDYIESKLREEQELLKGKEVEKVSISKILTNANMWKLIVIYMCFCIGTYGFSLWLPTLLKTLTHSGMTGVGLLSAIPYVGTIIGLYVFAQLSDRTMNRRLYTAIPLLAFGICLALSVVFRNNVWVSFAFLIGCGVFFQAQSSTFWTMPPLLFESDMAASSRGVINGLGNLGGFLGPYLVGFLTTLFNSGVGIYSLAGFMATMTLPEKTEGANTKSSLSKGQAIE